MRTIRSVSLWCNEGSSDKVYHIQLNEHEVEFIVGGQESAQLTYRVETQWGRRGSALMTGTKAEGVSHDKALRIFEKVKNEKLAKGYVVTNTESLSHDWPGLASQAQTNVPPTQHITVEVRVTSAPAGPRRKIIWDNPDAPDIQPVRPATPVGNPVPVIQVMPPGEKVQTGNHPQLLNEIDEEEAQRLLDDPDWGLQEKMNGTHKMVQWGRYRDRIYEPGLWVTNKKGILIAPTPDFINKITPALVGKPHMLLDGEQIGDNFYVYDILEHDLFEDTTIDLRGKSYSIRNHEITLQFARPTGIIRVPLYTRADKRVMYEEFKAQDKEGVVFKRLAAPFTAGKGHQDMWKRKFYAELSARVCPGRPGKNSIGLELLNAQGQWEFRGYCTVAPSKIPLPLEQLTGLVCEIKYLYVQGQQGHLYQPSFKEIRDDVDPSECTISQIKFKPEAL